MMSGIRGSNTKPELVLRSGLHRRGLRYRLHDKKLPGKPDMVFPKFHAVIFVDGCFWHGHDCHLFRWPQSRTEFWKNKIKGNIARDVANNEKLRAQGWRVCHVWECALKGKNRLPAEKIIDRCAKWLSGSRAEMEIRGA
jgi:DNA mismatch endonuclease (patch repair protein)